MQGDYVTIENSETEELYLIRIKVDEDSFLEKIKQILSEANISAHDLERVLKGSAGKFCENLNKEFGECIWSILMNEGKMVQSKKSLPTTPSYLNYGVSEGRIYSVFEIPKSQMSEQGLSEIERRVLEQEHRSYQEIFNDYKPKLV